MWIIDYADKTSNVFMFASAVAFLAPLLRELSAKLDEESLAGIEARLKAENKPTGKLNAIRERFREEDFRGYKQHQKTIAAGIFLLILGGIFLAIDVVKALPIWG
jgi:hypothetical protein